MMCVQELDPDTTATSAGPAGAVLITAEMDAWKQSDSARHVMTLRSWDNCDLPKTPTHALLPTSGINKSTVCRTTRWRRKCSVATIFTMLEQTDSGAEDVNEYRHACECDHALIDSYTTCSQCHSVRGQCVFCAGVATPEAVEFGLSLILAGDESYASCGVADVDAIGSWGSFGAWKTPCSAFVMNSMHSVCLCGVRGTMPGDDTVTIDKT